MTVKQAHIVLDTKIDEFMKLSVEALMEKVNQLEEYRDLISLRIDENPNDFADNRLRKNERLSVNTLIDVFWHRIEELNDKTIRKE